MKFGFYLNSINEYDESNKVLSLIRNEGDRSIWDSVHFLKARNFFNLKNTSSSLESFLKVSEGSVYFEQSRFKAGFLYAHKKEFNSAISIIQTIKTTSDTVRLLSNHLRAGVFLLQKDLVSFQQIYLDTVNHIVSNEGMAFISYSKALGKLNMKSPIVAGLLSSMVPGLGKLYAGFKGQALGSFLPVVSTAAMTYENYRRFGVKSFPFIASASLFSIFYLGNVWGSVLSVKIKYNEKKREIDNKILVDLYAPLDRVYQ